MKDIPAAATRISEGAGDAARPRVSVAMAVHNGLPYLEESVRSILGQTLEDFEFVIGDDGSSDGSSELLHALAAEDRRIRLIRRERPSGLAGSANWVVRETRAPLVAIMHADDLSHPDRLMRQFALMDRETDVHLVGVLCDGIDEKGRRVRAADWWRLGRRSPFAPFPHSAIMFRRDAFEKAGAYRSEADYWEDLDLYFRIAERGRILVIPQVLASVRFTAMSSRLTSQAERVDRAIDLMCRSVDDFMQGGAYPSRFPRPGMKMRPETFFGRGSV
ncbi:MAG TPA: glycosyltransferase family A protein, partial [Allosphingosinicella sp.]|nr:glycosyltransferase family A protein [Allosphingosinicella sp.]